MKDSNAAGGEDADPYQAGTNHAPALGTPLRAHCALGPAQGGPPWDHRSLHLQNFFRGVDAARPHRLTEGLHAFVPGIFRTEEGNPVKRIGKEASHAERFGRP